VRQSFRYNGLKGPFQVRSPHAAGVPRIGTSAAVAWPCLMRVRACGHKCRDRTAQPYAGVDWLQGLGATLIRNVPANSVYLGSFEVMKREVAKRQDKPVSQLHPGALASAAWAAPLQV
jgi:hypothetical protein